MSFTGDKFGSISGSLFAFTGTLAPAPALSQNNDRNNVKFFNDTNQTVYVSFGNLLNCNTTNKFTNKVVSQALWEPSRPTYCGPISIIWQTLPTTGSLVITETS